MSGRVYIYLLSLRYYLNYKYGFILKLETLGTKLQAAPLSSSLYFPAPLSPSAKSSGLLLYSMWASPLSGGTHLPEYKSIDVLCHPDTLPCALLPPETEEGIYVYSACTL